MKLLLGFMSVMFALNASATTETSRFFNISSSTDSIETILTADKTHTEYRTRTYTTTCERTETTWRTICTNPPRYPAPPRHPAPGPRPRYAYDPRYNPGPVCQTVPHHRTVIYSCQKTESVPYEVHDYSVEARVSINIINASQYRDAQGVIGAKLYGDILYLTASGSKKYLVMLKNRTAQSSISGGVKYMDVDYEVELVPAAPVLSQLSVSNLKVANNGLNIEMGKVSNLDQVVVHLKIYKDNLIGNDPTLIDRNLEGYELELSTTGSKTTARVDFSRLNLDVRGGKFNITATIEFADKNKVLNDIDFPNLKASKTIVQKIK